MESTKEITVFEIKLDQLKRDVFRFYDAVRPLLESNQPKEDLEE